MKNPVDFNNVKLLMNFDGENNSTTFLDGSLFAHSISAFGNAKLSNDVILISGTVGKFDGAGDYLKITSNASDFNLANNDFVIEAQFRLIAFNTTTNDSAIFGRFDSGVASCLLNIRNAGASSGLRFIIWLANSSSLDHTALYQFELNTDYQIAVIRKSNELRFFVNNTLIDTIAISQACGDALITTPLYIGCNVYAGSFYDYFNGYIDELRITIGESFNPDETQTQAFKIPSVSINLTKKNLAATDFAVFVYELKTGELLIRHTVQQGVFNLPVPKIAPVYVVAMPHQGDVWKPSTAYAVNDLVFPMNTNSTPYYYKRLSSGTSGTTEPTWNTLPNGQCNDGAVSNAWERVAGLVHPITKSFIIPV